MRTKPTKSLFTILILQLIALLLASCASAAGRQMVTKTRLSKIIIFEFRVCEKGKYE